MKRFVKLSAMVAALGLIVTVALVLHHDAQPKHLRMVAPGILIRSGLLRPQNLERVLDEYRIHTVVNLVPDLPENEHRLREERRICQANGVRLVELPMAPAHPPTPAQLERWLDLFRDEANHPILIHCKHGVVRTGVMVAIFRMEVLLESNATVLDELPMFGRDLDDPDLKLVRDYIARYEPSWKRKGPPDPGQLTEAVGP